jgi:protocatechuate 3,4-dioxygenase beta subunit
VVTTTDSQGSFRFPGLPTIGNYNVTLSKRHYTFLPATQNITDVTDDVSLTFDARLTLFAITGTALDENHAPLAGATVNLTGSQSAVTTTDSQGSFRFPGLPTNGNYNVALSKRHYTFLPATQNITDVTADVSLTFDARLTLFAIAGTALDENRAPLAGVTVNLTGSQSVVTTTDSQGSFRFPGLPNNWQLQCYVEASVITLSCQPLKTLPM